jgi:UDP-N-acetylmuramoylalanine--D-glutamate ligase
VLKLGRADFIGKKILVLGAGISGRAAAEVLARHEAKVTLNDRKEVDMDKKPWSALRAAGVNLVFGSQENTLLDDTDIVVASPVIPREVPIMAEAIRRQIPLWSEVEVACRLTDADILGVTGTNGKTTTTTLLGDIMEATGRHTVVGGNIGIGLSEQAADLPASAVVVAELSSFQLENTLSLKAKAACILNITPDHLDRHHTMENYAAVKERVFQNQGQGDWAVLNYDDPLIRPMADRCGGGVLYFSTCGEVPVGAFYADGDLILRMNGQDQLICHEQELQLFGKHNIQNCLAAALLAYAAGAPLTVIQHVLKTFRGVEHRIEPVRTIDGVKYFNDSKATNTDAAIKALEAFSGHLVLIAGGHDKMTPLEEFMGLAAKKVDTLILIGEATERFEAAAKQAGIADIRKAGFSMEAAVKMARDIASPPQVVLLSPACSSFDMFNNFEERGRIFKEYVNQL